MHNVEHELYDELDDAQLVQVLHILVLDEVLHDAPLVQVLHMQAQDDVAQIQED